ncbi:MAG: plasmid mobilization protein [Aestuariivirga sp.]
MTASKRSKPPPKRPRDVDYHFRMSQEERATARALAAKAGLALGAFSRACILGDAGPRAKRRPTADHAALRQILGHIGRTGNNINQIARRLNAGEKAHIPELREALAAHLEIRNAIFVALGMKPPSPPAPPGHDHQGH